MIFDSDISANIVIEPHQRAADSNLTRKNIIKYLDAFGLLARANFWLAYISKLGGTCYGLRYQFLIPARMVLLKMVFFCKRAMKGPIPEGLDLQGLNFPQSI